MWSLLFLHRKENTVLRGALNPSIVHVIPNAVVVSQFKPVEPTPPIPEIRKYFVVYAKLSQFLLY